MHCGWGGHPSHSKAIWLRSLFSLSLGLNLMFFFQGAGGAKRLAFARVHGDPGVWACSPQRVYHDLPGGAFH